MDLNTQLEDISLRLTQCRALLNLVIDGEGQPTGQLIDAAAGVMVLLHGAQGMVGDLIGKTNKPDTKEAARSEDEGDTPLLDDAIAALRDIVEDLDNTMVLPRSYLETLMERKAKLA